MHIHTAAARTPIAPRPDSETPFATFGTVQNVPADSEIFVEGESADRFFRVVSGTVRVCKFLDDGRRQIEAFHGAGDVFGLEADSEYHMSAEAVTDCSLIAYRRAGIESQAGTDPGLAGQLYSCVLRDLSRARDHALLLARKGALEKIAAFLLGLGAARQTVNLTMSRQDIADYLGLTIETVSRALSQFERDGLIALPNTREVHLKNVAALEHLAA